MDAMSRPYRPIAIVARAGAAVSNPEQRGLAIGRTHWSAPTRRDEAAKPERGAIKTNRVSHRSSLTQELQISQLSRRLPRQAEQCGSVGLLLGGVHQDMCQILPERKWVLHRLRGDDPR